VINRARTVRIVILAMFLLVLAARVSSCMPKEEPQPNTFADRSDEEIQPDTEHSVTQAGTWFLRHADEEEFLHYGYWPNEQQPHTGRNSLRIAGALWSITELHRFTGDERFAKLAENGIEFFRAFIIKDPEGYAYVDIANKHKLGFNAFLILALLNLEDIPDRTELMSLLAEGILHQQRRDGSYATYFHSDQATGVDYYPGEANLALMALYEETGAERYREAVERSFPYYREYWRGNKTLAFIPWHAQALSRLYRSTPDPQVRDFVFEMTDWMLTFQKQGTNPATGTRRYISAPTISTASYLEGINDAYKLAKSVGDEERTQGYAEAIRLGTAFVRELQMTGDEYTADGRTDPLAAGGVRQSITNPELRVDHTQHAVAAWIKALENDLAQ